MMPTIEAPTTIDGLISEVKNLLPLGSSKLEEIKKGEYSTYVHGVAIQGHQIYHWSGTPKTVYEEVYNTKTGTFTSGHKGQHPSPPRIDTTPKEEAVTAFLEQCINTIKKIKASQTKKVISQGEKDIGVIAEISENEFGEFSY